MERREALKGTAMILGTAISGSMVAALIQACSPGTKLTWVPQILGEFQAKTLSAIVDRILPATSTPGAIEAGVDQFIDKMLYNVFPQDIQQGFQKGLDDFNASAKTEFGKDFLQLNSDQQNELIQKFEEKSGPLPGSMWGFSFGEPKEFPFYRMMKELALLGYFQSEKIGKEILAYDPIPGPYEGCISYSDVGKIWSE